MSNTGEQMRPPQDIVHRVQAKELQRFYELGTFLQEALPQVGDLARCNAAFAAANRADLVLDEVALMKPYFRIRDILDIDGGNNFASRFAFFSWDEDIDYSGVEFEYGKPVAKPVPISEEQVDGLIDGSFAMEEAYYNFSRTPAFLRMLILFPDFTKQLVLNCSQPDARSRLDDYGPELFVAYQLMSRLVSPNDPGVIRDGKVQDRILCV